MYAESELYRAAIESVIDSYSGKSMSISGNRVVIGLNGDVTAAVHKDNLIKA